MTRRIVDLRDVNTQELVYPATHSDAVLMPDGKTVTEAIANSGGGSSISSAAYPLVSHGTNDTTFTLTPNTYHVWDVVEQLDIALGEEIEGVVNEFVFQFSTGETPTSLTLPEGLMWAKETNLSLSAYATYKVSIYNGLITLSEYNTYIVNEIKLTPIEGSTFIEWESKYPLAEDIHLYLLNSKYLGVMSAGQQWGELDRGYTSGEYACLISFTAGAEPDTQEITDGTYLYRIQETIELPPVFD